MSIYHAFARAARESGRSVLSLLAEAMRLRFSRGRMGLSEYIDYRLYLNDLQFADKAAFGGWRAQAVLESILVDDYARFLCLDKITMYSLLRGYGLPIPEVRAVYGSPRPGGMRSLHSAEALVQYLKTAAPLPLYLKPSFGGRGQGNALLSGVDGDSLVLGDGSRVDLRRFCESLNDGRALGWILQDVLIPHADIAGLCGPKISGVRVHSFLAAAGPQITRAIFKVNVGREDCDNFRRGETGNMGAAVDLETGEVTRVVSGVGLDQQINPPHAASGKQLLGFRLPCWAQVKALVCEAQLAFPGYLCPGWDIAICDDGPRILEVNFMGDLDLSQYACRVGFLDDEFLRLMRGRGLDRAVTGVSRRSSRTSNAARIRQWGW